VFAFIIAGLLATSADEQITRPPLAGFVVGNQQSSGGASILEEVPAGETVQKWTRMVTTQRFEGLAERLDAAGFLNMLAKATARSCTDLHVFQVAWRSVPSANDVVWGERYLDGVSVKP